MVKIKSGKKVYNYSTECMETIKIDKKVKEDVALFCKNRKINKSKLVENFYKNILIKFRDGSLGSSGGYLTINIFTK